MQGQCNLFCDGFMVDIFLWEGLVQNGYWFSEYFFYWFVGQGLCVFCLVDGDCLWMVDVVDYYWWFYVVGIIVLYLVVLCEDKIVQMFVEVFYYVVLFGFFVYQYV